MRTMSLLIAAILGLSASQAAADGVFVWRNRNVDILEPEQKAFILFDGGWEDLILEVKYEGAVSDFGWIVPLPSEPEMSPGEAEIFEYLSQATQEPKLGRSELGVRLGATAGEGVEVLKRERVGIYDATVLAARGSDDLSLWLKQNEFRLPEKASPTLDHYIQRDWVFVAMKIAVEAADSTTAERLSTGTIQPIRFHFQSPEPVYPLKISSILPGETDVLLYVVARDQLVNANCKHVKWENHIYGRLEDFSWYPGRAKVPNLSGGGGYLSKLRARFRPEEMDDVVFESYDPVMGLRSRKTLSDRAEAASHLGRRKSPDGVPLLVDYLRENPDCDVDVLSALWALGEIGGPDAVECLIGRTKSSSLECRVEAIESLARLETKEAFPIFISGLADGRVVRDACLQHLLALADESCIPELETLAQRRGRDLAAINEWHKETRPTTGMCATYALAACGDADAEEFIRRRTSGT
ncbi:MAG: DUF2330 domain-containing protein [Acidobacteriota bacterium]